MALARASGQATGTHVENASSASLAYPGNVTAGNLLVVGVSRWHDVTADAIVVGDISMSSGTATLGTWQLDFSVEGLSGAGGDNREAYAFFSCPVTGSGSCTIQVAGGPSGSYWGIGLQEYSGADVTSSRFVGSNSVEAGFSNSADSGTVASGGAAVFVGQVWVDIGAAITITEDAAYTLISEYEWGHIGQIAAFADRIVTSNTTDSASWALSGVYDWGCAVGVYKEASGAAAPSGTAPWSSIWRPARV